LALRLSLRKKRKKKKFKERKKEQKKEETNKQTNKKQEPTASHPSVQGQRPQERWIGAHCMVITGDTRCPATIFQLRSALLDTGVLSVGRGRRESILYAGAEPATRLLGRQHSDLSLQAKEPSQLPAKTMFKFNIYTPASCNEWRRQTTLHRKKPIVRK